MCVILFADMMFCMMSDGDISMVRAVYSKISRLELKKKRVPKMLVRRRELARLKEMSRHDYAKQLHKDWSLDALQIIAKYGELTEKDYHRNLAVSDGGKFAICVCGKIRETDLMKSYYYGDYTYERLCDKSSTITRKEFENDILRPKYRGNATDSRKFTTNPDSKLSDGTMFRDFDEKVSTKFMDIRLQAAHETAKAIQAAHEAAKARNLQRMADLEIDEALEGKVI